ncbi:glycosyltransferase [Candidatus Neomarinimicrobiota bacterium]
MSQQEAGTPAVSVIVLNYNGLRFLERLFNSLLDDSFGDRELIMVDNASTDESVAYVREHYPGVRIIESGRNIGFATGNNLGIQNAIGEYVVLLNNDIEVADGWLSPLVEELDSHPEIAAVQPKLRQIADRTSFEYAGAAGGYIDPYGYPFLRGRVFGNIEQDNGQYDTAEDVFWTSGAAMAIRKSSLDKVGLLDEDFVFHMEEIDLCWRLLLQGNRLRVRPDAVVYHHGGGSLRTDSYRKIYWNHRNSLLMLIKNYGPSRLLARLPVRLVLDVVLILKSLITLDLKRAVAVPAGYLWLLAHTGTVLAKRREVQSKRHLPDSSLDHLMLKGSLVAAYYLRGKRSFSEIWGRG